MSRANTLKPIATANTTTWPGAMAFVTVFTQGARARRTSLLWATVRVYRTHVRKAACTSQRRRLATALDLRGRVNCTRWSYLTLRPAPQLTASHTMAFVAAPESSPTWTRLAASGEWPAKVRANRIPAWSSWTASALSCTREVPAGPVNGWHRYAPIPIAFASAENVNANPTTRHTKQRTACKVVTRRALESPGTWWNTRVGKRVLVVEVQLIEGVSELEERNLYTILEAPVYMSDPNSNNTVNNRMQPHTPPIAH